MTENLLLGSTPAFDETKNWYEELTKEGGKFYDPDPEVARQKLAKGKAYSDHYISTLEQDRDAMRNDYLKLKAEYDAVNKLEEAIKRFDSQSHQRDDTLTSNDEDTKPPVKDFDPKMIESLVSSQLNELKNKEREQENFNKVKAKIIERYGESFNSSLNAQAERLGLTPKEVDEMARRQPNLFIKTFDLDVPPTRDGFQAPPTSSKRNDNFAPSGRQARKKSYYEKLRKEDPKAYLDPKTLVQMEKDVQAIGWEAFNDI